MIKQERAPALLLQPGLTRRKEISRLTTQENFIRLYQAYVNPVFRYLYTRVNSVQDAEDLTSQTFLKAYQSYATLRDQDRFAPWLFTIARNKLNDFYRQRKNNIALIPETIEDDLPAPNVVFEMDERFKQLRLSVFALSDDDQELIRLRYFGELTYREIAETVGRSEQSVKKNIYRLLARLKSQVE